MKGGLVLKLAWRNLGRNRRRTLITLASITFSLAVAIGFKSLSAGLSQQGIDRATKRGIGHLSIEDPGYRDDPSVAKVVTSLTEIRRSISTIKGIKQLRPQLIAQGMLSTPAGSIGVGLIGIDPNLERSVSPFASSIIEGRFIKNGDARAVIVGAKLASRFKLRNGKKFVFTTTNARGELTSALLQVVGVFRMNLDDVDGRVMLTPIEVSRKILGLKSDQANVVGVLLSKPDEQEQIRKRIVSALKGRSVAVRTWQETLPEIAGLVEVGRSSRAMLANIVLLLVAFTILNTILMSAVERGREFAVLLALGTDARMIRMQIMAEAALLASMGCACGLFIGGAASLWAGAQGIDLSPFFPGDVSSGNTSLDTVVHPRLTTSNAVGTTVLVFLLTLGAALYPMIRSTKIHVAHILRNR